MSTQEADQKLASGAWDLIRKGVGSWRMRVAALGVALTFTVRAAACDDPHPDAVDFKWWGEHCGPGHGTDGDAVDELDALCKKHDREVP
jgi:hypothetical protein